MTDSKDAVTLAMMRRVFRDGVPHNKAMGIDVVRASHDEGVVVLCLPWDEKLVGDPETEVLHGGAITTLMDTACGAAVSVKMAPPTPVATLDLRIDYLKPATPRVTVFARAECFKVTRHVAFVRVTAYHEPDDVIASGNGTFMIATKGRPVIEAV